MRPNFASPRVGGMVALALVIALLPVGLSNNYFYDVAILVGLNAIVCVGLNLLIGYAGQISLGHAGFYGLGAYGSAILSSRYGWPPLVSMLSATLVVAALAFVVGRPILRLKGHYLAMATLGIGLIIHAILRANPFDITGGQGGIPGLGQGGPGGARATAGPGAPAQGRGRARESSQGAGRGRRPQPAGGRG